MATKRPPHKERLGITGDTGKASHMPLASAQSSPPGGPNVDSSVKVNIPQRPLGQLETGNRGVM